MTAGRSPIDDIRASLAPIATLGAIRRWLLPLSGAIGDITDEETFTKRLHEVWEVCDFMPPGAFCREAWDECVAAHRSFPTAREIFRVVSRYAADGPYTPVPVPRPQPSW